jgi:beta-lactamase class A
MPRKSYDDVIADPTKMSAEEKIGRTKQKLHESDRRSLNSDIERREQEILAKKDLNPDADVSDLKKEIVHKKMILQHDDDLVPKSGNERDRLAARAKTIEDVLKKEMPTKREMWPKPGSVESQQAVRHNLKFQEQRDGLCKEWQEIQKKLNPEDPYAQSLELIRPD